MIDPALLLKTGFGLLVILVAWLPLAVSRLPLSLAIICVAIGFGCGQVLPTWPDPVADGGAVQTLAEIVVIVSLMGAGLKIDRPLSWRGWMSTWRLLGITMPITILAITILGVWTLAMPLGAALLLAAALAPTDPVLASDIQVGPPGSGEDGDTRFALTSEAGLNDGLAFPFVHLAIAVAMAGGALSLESAGEWLARDVAWRILIGTAIGALVGWIAGWAAFHLPHPARLSRTGDGFLALGLTFASYGLAEMAMGYGFLAVFATALAFRASERDNRFHHELHDFAEQIERILMMIVLVLFGGAIAHGLLAPLTLWDMAAGLIIVFLVRPLAGLIGLARGPWSGEEKAMVAFFGIRGIGSFYYLAYGINHGADLEADRLWALTGFIVLVSVLVHGVTVTPLMERLDEAKDRAD